MSNVPMPGDGGGRGTGTHGGGGGGGKYANPWGDVPHGGERYESRDVWLAHLCDVHKNDATQPPGARQIYMIHNGGLQGVRAFAHNASGGGNGHPQDGSNRPGNVSGGGNGHESSNLMDLIHQAGFQGEAANIAYAIVMAESGGNATAHNTNAGTGDNSYGLAQINMIGSLGPERLREYGLSSYNQLFDPLTNLRVMYKMSGGGRDWTPWSTYKSGAYTAYLGQSGAQISNMGHGGGAAGDFSGGGGTVNLSAADYKAALGDLSGLLTGIPELNHILQQAVAGGWSTNKFEQAIQQTDWYRQHDAAARELISLKYQDPAEYKSRIQQAYLQVQQAASQEGVDLTNQQMETLAQRSIIESWSSQTLQNAVGSHWAQGQGLQGQAAQYAQQLHQIYADQGVPMSQKALDWRVQQLLSGKQTIDTYSQAALDAAKSMYPGLAHQLDNGQTVKDIADPYMQTMSNLLELDPNSIRIDNPLIKKALQGSIVQDGNKASTTTTPMWKFEQQVRADPRWQMTDNAHQEVSSVLNYLGQSWGFLA